MKRFQFQFASVLNVRKMREDAALRALGASQRALAQAVSAKKELESKLSDALDRREKLGLNPTTAVSFRTEQDFIDGQKARIVRQEHVIIRAQRSVEKSLKTYLGTRRQTEMMERLKETHYGEFKKRLAKKDQKELEDLATMRSMLIERERREDEIMDLEVDAKNGGDAA